MPLICEYARALSRDGASYDPPWLLPIVDEVQQWFDPDEQTYVGICDALGAGGVELSGAELLARVQAIHAAHPIYDHTTGAAYTDEALEAAVADWISAAGA